MSVSLIFDIIASLVCLAGAFLSYNKGFFQEASSKMSFFTGFIFALMLTNTASVFIVKRLDYSINPILLSLLCFLIIFLLFSFGTRYLGLALGKMMKSLHLEIVDKILGFILGIFEMVIIITLIVTIFEHQALFDFSKVSGDSYFCKLICQNVKYLFNMGLENIQKI